MVINSAVCSVNTTLIFTTEHYFVVKALSSAKILFYQFEEDYNFSLRPQDF
jgi:hypothetical protein